jgi:hypothetical protein
MALIQTTLKLYYHCYHRSLDVEVGNFLCDARRRMFVKWKAPTTAEKRSYTEEPGIILQWETTQGFSIQFNHFIKKEEKEPPGKILIDDDILFLREIHRRKWF